MVDEYPNAPAITGDFPLVTYAALDAMADSILAKFYDKEYPTVGIVMRHGPLQVAAMLAVLKSGAAYVPAEPSLPEVRRRYMMEQAGVELVIDDAYCHDLAPVHEAMEDRSRPDGLAYILYTSGTTGHPKGVQVENHSVVNYAMAFEEEFHTGPGDVMLQYSVCSFDIFVEEVYATLLNGAALAIPPDALRRADVGRLMEWAESHGVTEISGFPYLLAELNDLPSIPSSLRLLISGGDVLRGAYIDRLRDSGAVIYNTYGPSETTVCATYQRVDNIPPLPDGTFPIGHPVKGVEVKVMDSALRELPAGKQGEICILGEGVSRGYLGAPPEQRNFTTAPDGRRLYRSGDLGYILPDGTLAFLHRKDDQVMILGKRVEPEEVENVLNESPDVQRAIVRPFTDESGLSYLVAYVVPAVRKNLLHRVKAWLGRQLADFMIPEFFVAVDRIPLNSHGKVDVSALPIILKEGGVK